MTRSTWTRRWFGSGSVTGNSPLPPLTPDQVVTEYVFQETEGEESDAREPGGPCLPSLLLLLQPGPGSRTDKQTQLSLRPPRGRPSGQV